MALDSLFSTKLRSLLTLLGLMIGVGTVIAMMAIISGLNASMRRQIASLGSGILYVSKYEAGIHVGDGGRRKPRKDLTRADAEAVAEQCASAAGVSAEIQDGVYVSAGQVKTSFVGLYGVTPSFCEVNDWFPSEGRFLNADDLKHRSRVCVLGRGPPVCSSPTAARWASGSTWKARPTRSSASSRPRGSFSAGAWTMSSPCPCPWWLGCGSTGSRSTIWWCARAARP